MINHWMFRCRDVSAKVSLSMDTSLPLLERMAIRFHLMMCRYCGRFRRQLIMLRAVCRQVDTDPMPEGDSPGLSQEAKARLREKLRSLS